ncbi:MAG: UDP-N-acetylmuramyl-tripeptide synthetase [Clostridiales bacterium]|nr:MAG: UDP-N-acetylmuramyl-tripeptide synthetase [Clostridiales bacterium]
MELRKLDYYVCELKKIGQIISVNGETDFNIKNLTYNSKDVIKNTLFICKGVNFNEDYLQEAILKGAAAYIIDENKYNSLSLKDLNITYILVKDIRKTMAIVANIFYNKPLDFIKLVGITGTKGKTTAAYFTKSILDKKEDSGLISGIDIYNGKTYEEAKLTTPESVELFKYLYQMTENNINMSVMEVSSQALKYDRVYDVEFFIGVYLNLGEDHISPFEHKDFSDYMQSKLKLMSQSKNVVINIDDKYADAFIQKAKESRFKPKIVTFSRLGNTSADIYCENYEELRSGQRFTLTVKRKSDILKKQITLKMGGVFNITNALAACAVADILGVDTEKWSAGLENALVSGRMEEYYLEEKNVKIVVDYAHNQMSFNSLLDSVYEKYKKENIFMVYGCPGKKAFDRREKLPKISAERVGFTYITEEDPSSESLIKICDEVYDNLKKFGGNGEIVLDREKAILKAINSSKNGDIILILGKGREEFQKRKSGYEYYLSDVKVVENYIENK